MKYKVGPRPGWSVHGELNDWLNSLTEKQIQELGSMDYGSGGYDNRDIRPIIKDWIEEHGGEREWWIAIYTQVIR